MQLPRARLPRPSLRNLSLAALLLAPLVPLAACSDSLEGAERTLYFSAIPDANKSDLAAKYGLIAEHLSRELGIKVEYKPSSSYGASVEAFKNQDIQLAWFGGVTGVQARLAVDGARAIAQGRVDPEYYSYFIAHKDTGIEPDESFPAMLAGKTFLFGAPDSTSGRVMPEYFIRRHGGKTPEEFFRHPNKFSGAHDLTALAVQDGSAQAGALSYKTYDAMVADGRIDPQVCRVIWRTPVYPDYNWTAHPVLSERFGAEFIERLQGVLVAMSDPELLSAMMRPEGIIPATNEDFRSLEQSMHDIGMTR